MSFSTCQQSTKTPCRVPHVKDILENDTYHNLSKCSTMWDFNCQKWIITLSSQAINKCIRPCYNINYKVIPQSGLRVDRALVLFNAYKLFILLSTFSKYPQNAMFGDPSGTRLTVTALRIKFSTNKAVVHREYEVQKFIFNYMLRSSFLNSSPFTLPIN